MKRNFGQLSVPDDDDDDDKKKVNAVHYYYFNNTHFMMKTKLEKEYGLSQKLATVLVNDIEGNIGQYQRRRRIGVIRKQFNKLCKEFEQEQKKSNKTKIVLLRLSYALKHGIVDDFEEEMMMMKRHNYNDCCCDYTCDIEKLVKVLVEYLLKLSWLPFAKKNFIPDASQFGDILFVYCVAHTHLDLLRFFILNTKYNDYTVTIMINSAFKHERIESFRLLTMMMLELPLFRKSIFDHHQDRLCDVLRGKGSVELFKLVLSVKPKEAVQFHTNLYDFNHPYCIAVNNNLVEIMKIIEDDYMPKEHIEGGAFISYCVVDAIMEKSHDALRHLLEKFVSKSEIIKTWLREQVEKISGIIEGSFDLLSLKLMLCNIPDLFRERKYWPERLLELAMGDAKKKFALCLVKYYNPNFGTDDVKGHIMKSVLEQKEEKSQQQQNHSNSYNNNNNNLINLPPELFLKILSFLDITTIRALMLTCTTFYNMFCCAGTLRHFVRTRFLHILKFSKKLTTSLIKNELMMMQDYECEVLSSYETFRIIIALARLESQFYEIENPDFMKIDLALKHGIIKDFKLLTNYDDAQLVLLTRYITKKKRWNWRRIHLDLDLRVSSFIFTIIYMLNKCVKLGHSKLSKFLFVEFKRRYDPHCDVHKLILAKNVLESGSFKIARFPLETFLDDTEVWPGKLIMLKAYARKGMFEHFKTLYRAIPIITPNGLRCELAGTYEQAAVGEHINIMKFIDKTYLNQGGGGRKCTTWFFRERIDTMNKVVKLGKFKVVRYIFDHFIIKNEKLKRRFLKCRFVDDDDDEDKLSHYLYNFLDYTIQYDNFDLLKYVLDKLDYIDRCLDTNDFFFLVKAMNLGRTKIAEYFINNFSYINRYPNQMKPHLLRRLIRQQDKM